MKTLSTHLDQIEEIINQKDFLNKKGMGNEVGYYIFSYPETEELRVREHVRVLEKRHNPNITGYELKVFDVYDLMLDLIEKEGLMEACAQMEQEIGMDYLITSVCQLMNMDQDSNYLTTYVENHTPEKAIVFIIGVGKIFPFVRSHDILNKMHQVFERVPVVLFYPGKYDGQKLKLFSEFTDDHYYRAFPLIR